MTLTLAYHAASWADMAPHTATLTALAAEARSIVELGVRGAVSTWAMLDGLPADGRLTSVDIDEHVEDLIPDRVRSDPRWTLLTGDDVELRDDLPAADLVFIDTSHEYHHTVHELAIAVRLGARTIVLHDWMVPDVQDAVLGFVHRTGATLEIEPSQWGLAVVRR